MSKFAQGNHKSAKLTNEQVMELRRLYFDEGWNQAALARHYQVNVNTVGRIVRGESRQRVPMMTEPPEVIQQRLWEMQQRINQQTEEKLKQDLIKQPAIQSQVEEDKFADWAAAERYGAAPPTKESTK